MQLSAWIFGYGRILHEVFRRVSFMDITRTNPYKEVDFDFLWPAKGDLRVLLKIIAEKGTFEILDSPSRLLGLCSDILNTVATGFEWGGITLEELEKMLSAAHKLVEAAVDLRESVRREIDEINESKKGVRLDE